MNCVCVFANVFRILFVKNYKFFSLFKEVFYVNLYFWRNCNFSRDLRDFKRE